MHNHAAIDVLLKREADAIQDWLDGFYPAASRRLRRVVVGRTGEYLIVQAMPLPDGYRPDEIDVLLLVDNFPSLPPIGLYVLNRGNEAVVAQLRRKINAFANAAYHSAPSIEGYTWLCYAYADNRWKFNATAPHRGDNLRKYIAAFYAEIDT